MTQLISRNKVKVRHFHFTQQCVDEVWAIADSNKFRRTFIEIYHKKLELKLDYQDTNASFLILVLI